MKKLASFRPDDIARQPNHPDVLCRLADEQDLPRRILDWEHGELSEESTLDLFQELVSTGVAWKCHGAVRRTAALLISEGRIRQ